MPAPNSRSKTTQGRPRSKKAGRPPREVPAPPRVKRRQRRATVAVRKDTMLLQTPDDPKLIAGRRPPKK